MKESWSLDASLTIDALVEAKTNLEKLPFSRNYKIEVDLRDPWFSDKPRTEKCIRLSWCHKYSFIGADISSRGKYHLDAVPKITYWWIGNLMGFSMRRYKTFERFQEDFLAHFEDGYLVYPGNKEEMTFE